MYFASVPLPIESTPCYIPIIEYGKIRHPQNRNKHKEFPPKKNTKKKKSSLVALQVKDLAMSLQWLRSLLGLRLDPWSRNLHIPWVWPKKYKNKNNQEKYLLPS